MCIRDSVLAAILWANMNISITVILAARDVSFTSPIRELLSGGDVYKRQAHVRTGTLAQIGFCYNQPCFMKRQIFFDDDRAFG